MSRPYHVLNWTLLPLLRWRIRSIHGVEHLPSTGGYIVIANHQSWLDSGILGGALYQHVTRSLKFVALSSKYRLLGGLPIDEYDRSHVLDIALGYARAGHPIVVFPEGNSNPAGELRVGKTGAARLALRSGLPVVPVGIQGTYGVSFFQAVWWFLCWWKPCRIVIGQPLQFPPHHEEAIDRPLLEVRTGEMMEAISRVSGKRFIPGMIPHSPSPTFYSWLVRRVLFPMLQWRVRTVGTEYLPQHGPYIVVANHHTYFDAPTISMAVYRARKIMPFFLTKPSIAASFARFFGPKLLPSIGMVAIDATDRAKVLQPAESHLRHGGVIGIFPEGMRNTPKKNPTWEKTMLKGKTGTARLWLHQHVPIIPAAINAPVNGFGVSGALIGVLKFWQFTTVTFGPPVAITHQVSGEPTKEDLETITREILQPVAALCGRTYPY